MFNQKVEAYVMSRALLLIPIVICIILYGRVRGGGVNTHTHMLKSISSLPYSEY